MSVIKHTTDGLLLFWCPACLRSHGVNTTWSWNGDNNLPTFRPSLAVSYDAPDAGVDGAPPRMCHSFVTNGTIEFLPDSTHGLSGQTVSLVRWPN
jgi:hypothetical protein